MREKCYFNKMTLQEIALANQLYSEITRDIIVIVQPEYMPDTSKPEENYYFWAYHITIENGSNDTVQLIERHWKIIDEAGQLAEVVGEGVIGRQPILKPGETVQYTSGTPLATPSGIMYGTYLMRSQHGEEFTVTIPTFSLDSDHSARIVH